MEQIFKNKRFITTRAKGQSEELRQLFEKTGAELVEMPMIKVKATDLPESEKEYFSRLKNFQWLLFTSLNGVCYFFEKLQQFSGTSKLPACIEIAVIGDKTEMTLNQFGYEPGFKNPGLTGEDFAQAFSPVMETGKTKPNVLLALGNLAKNNIQDRLSKVANCTRIDVYQTVMPEEVDSNILKLITDDDYEMMIFTSPSGIQNFVKLAKNIRPEKLRLACIGTVTAKAAENLGIHPVVVADTPSEEGIFNSIVHYYKSEIIKNE